MGQTTNHWCCEERPPILDESEISEDMGKVRTVPKPKRYMQNGTLQLDSQKQDVTFLGRGSSKNYQKQTKQSEQARKNAEKRSKCLRFENFTIAYLIGSGHFSQVFLGCIKGTLKNKNARLYAIKQMKKSVIHSKKLTTHINLQKKIMKQTKSNFITRLYHSFQDDHYYYLVMEWAQEGDVYSFIKPGSKRKDIFRFLGQTAIRFILGCIVLGLEALHSQNVVYYDLKPENMLVFQDGYIKLTDFGLSQQIGKNSNTWKLIGTPMYNSPQMVARHQYGRYVDLWALGVISYELSNFFPPFDLDDIADKDKFIKRVRISERKRKWLNINITDELKDFIDSLLKLDPESRLGANSWAQIKNHSFFKKVNFDWSALQKKQLVSPLLPILKTKLEYEKADVTKIRSEYWENSKKQKYQPIQGWSESWEQEG